MATCRFRTRSSQGRSPLSQPARATRLGHISSRPSPTRMRATTETMSPASFSVSGVSYRIGLLLARLRCTPPATLLNDESAPRPLMSLLPPDDAVNRRGVDRSPLRVPHGGSVTTAEIHGKPAATETALPPLWTLRDASGAGPMRNNGSGGMFPPRPQDRTMRVRRRDSLLSVAVYCLRSARRSVLDAHTARNRLCAIA
jgi:hypothetical protein